MPADPRLPTLALECSALRYPIVWFVLQDKSHYENTLNALLYGVYPGNVSYVLSSFSSLNFNMLHMQNLVLNSRCRTSFLAPYIPKSELRSCQRFTASQAIPSLMNEFVDFIFINSILGDIQSVATRKAN